ncbi:MAG: TIGR02099 family protein [Candidatus Polarisedimenticolaceae bacterium]|nr:TIGR02099 family protein [Candidatus Polarisedimenticolaceae bacterium]
MIRLAKAITVKLWQIFLLLVVLTGILVAVARVVLPELSAYRNQAIVWAEEALGQPVQISSMSLRWRGFGPQLILQDAALLDADGRKSLQFAQIRFDFGLLDALLTGVAVPRQITIVGATLRVERRADGSVAIVGLGASPASPGHAETAMLLPWRLSLQDSKLLWDDQLLGQKPLRLHLIQAQFAHDGERHQIDVELDLPEGAGRVRLSVDATGRPGSPDSWVARFYVASDNLLLPALLQPYQPEHYLLQQGRAGFELWGRWQAGSLDQLLGRLELQELQLLHQQRPRPQSLNVEQLAGRFQWRREDQGWRFDAADIQFQQAGESGQKSNLSIVSQRRVLRMELDALQLADARAVAAILPLAEGAFDALAGLQPQALITQLSMDYDRTTDTPDWRISGRFNDLQILPWSDIPGIKHLSGRLEADPASGAVLLDSQQVQLDFKGLFRAPFQLQQLSGLLQWERLPDAGWRLHSDELIAINSDLETRTRLLMDIPTASEQSIFLDLQTDFANGTVSSTRHYLPVGIMDDEVVSWLDRALVSGHLTSGSCVVRGQLRDFPYSNHKGRFEVLFGVEDLVLDYFPGWPRLEEVATEVRFLDDRFDAWIVDGKILNSEIQQAHGWIGQLSESTPFKLAGQVNGTLSDSLRLLRETPLAEDFSATVAGMRAEGDAQVTVDLAIPLSDADPQPFRIDGRVRFKDSTLHLNDWQLSLVKMRGDLRFDEEGIRAEDIQTQVLDTAVHVDLQASPAMPDATQVTARAYLPMTTLAERFPGMGLNLLDGTANWTLQLDIPNKVAQSDAPVLISVASDLVGIAVDLPAPLGKKAADLRHLQLSTVLGGAPLQPVQGRYGDTLDFSLLLDLDAPGMLQRGELRLGGEKAVLPEADGLRLYARLDEFDLTPWLERAEEPAASGAAGRVPFSVVDIAIQQLHSDELTLNDVEVQLKQDNGEWTGPVATSMFDGDLTIPADLKNGTLSLRMNRIELNYKPKEDEGRAATRQVPPVPEQGVFLDPRDFPALHLKSEQVIVNGQNLGRVILTVDKDPEGLLLKQMEIKSERLTLTASGKWVQGSQKEPETALKFHLVLPKAGDLLTDMNITHNIQGAEARIEGGFNWQGGPHRVSMQSLKGELSVDIGKGSILDVDPGIGRIFGLLNLNPSLFLRRLTLDFSDIYAKGFGFDRMLGSFEFKNGNAITKGFQINGPAAKILILGRVGLVKRDIDQTIVVAPQVSSSVNLATAIANPAAGVAMLLARSLMGDELDKITSYQYTVVGSWDEPEISEKESLFFGLPKDTNLPENPPGGAAASE